MPKKREKKHYEKPKVMKFKTIAESLGVCQPGSTPSGTLCQVGPSAYACYGGTSPTVGG